MHPGLIQHVLLPGHEYLLRRPTLRYLAALERSQWWPRERLVALQTRKLRRLLLRSAAASAFYRRRLDAAGVDPARATLASLAKLPLLSKGDIRENLGEMIDSAVPGGLHRYTTGGSTGEPLQFFICRMRQAADQAARARSRQWFGIQPGERELYLWGAPVELGAQDRLKVVRDGLLNHRLLSAFDMTPETMEGHLDEMRHYEPVHIFAYPSSLARLVRHADDCGRSVAGPALRAVFVTGELFSPDDRAIIEAAVGVPVADGYGAREAGFIAHQCPAGQYHVTMESLIVEILDEQGRRAGRGHRGEIVVTHLDGLGMPLVRYRTGDIGARSVARCRCGRGLETLEIVAGRSTDMLRTVNGGHAHALSVMYVLREEAAVREFKVTQQPGLDLDVDVVPAAGFDCATGDRIRRGLRRRIGERVDVRINLVNAIRPDPSGKHRCVVSHGERALEAADSPAPR